MISTDSTMQLIRDAATSTACSSLSGVHSTAKNREGIRTSKILFVIQEASVLPRGKVRPADKLQVKPAII